MASRRKKTPAPISKKPKTSTLLVLGSVMVVNALSYGILFPLLYPYAQRFGLGPLQLGLLLSSFSLFQFIATPIIGRLSDMYGRKPLLLLCLLGTAGSLALFALATTVPMLFLSRILDGITGGNNSVANAMIADTTSGKERTKAFGVLGAAFGIGFLIGPAIGGILSSISLTAPFWFASGFSLVAAVLGMYILPETAPKYIQKKSQPLFDPKGLVQALTHPVTGVLFLASLLVMTSHQALVVGFQSFSFDVLHMNTQEIGWFFAMIGLVSVLTQLKGISFLLKIFKKKTRILQVSLVATVLACFGMFFANSLTTFFIMTVFYVMSFVPQGVMITGLLSERTNKEDQGAMLGINQSYFSLGMIIGPLLAGVVSDKISISATFLLASGLFLFSLIMTRKVSESAKAIDI